MKILKSFLICGLLNTAFLFFISPAFASEPFIGDISVNNISGNLVLSAKLKGGITSNIAEIIHSGATTTFTYYIQLVRSRSGWFDSIEYSKTIKRTVKFDVLKKEYRFNEEADEPLVPINETEANKKQDKNPSPISPASQVENTGGVNERVTKDFEEVKKWLDELESIKLVSSKQIMYGSKYYINIKADLKTINLWFPFNYILFFVSFWDITTEWEVSSPFTAN